MKKFGKWGGQAILYAAFAATLAIFSHWPRYQHLEPDQALIKLSFTHQAQRLGECEELTAAELAKLPPNMRAPTRCPRERAPVTVEVDIDGVLAHRQVAKPSGLSNDGAAAVYQRLEVAAGRHVIAVRLKDDAHTAGFDYTAQEVVNLKPGEILVIDFDSANRRITLR
ncbi:MAG: hypothetical protein KAY03_05600 [Arenimonas sp.]|nr:hypothetical protein [Arenimonas sp.]